MQYETRQYQSKTIEYGADSLEPKLYFMRGE